MNAAPKRRPAAKPAARPVWTLPPMGRGAFLGALVVAAIAAVAAVTYPFHDTDLWQHLVVGKVLWQTHAIPTTQLWSWPTHGAPDVLPSWLFRALLWPVWNAAGFHGLFAWRWITTLVMFGLALLAARRMGATGVAPLFMLVWCVVFWRQRSQVRPETFAGILLAAELLLLEFRRQQQRQRGAASAAATGALGFLQREPAWGLVPIALVWINAHISFYLGFVIAGAYFLDDLANRSRGARPWGLVLPVAAAGLASLVNPFGWRAIMQPVEYFTTWRHEPVYLSIGELSPIYWDVHVRDGLALWFVVLAIGALVRWRRHGIDWAQLVMLLVCVPQALSTQRFLGYAALALAPYAARDFAGLASLVRWPVWLQPAAARAAVVACAIVLLVMPTLTQPAMGFGYGERPGVQPERACDWIEQHDVRGRAFNVFGFGGYMLYRFYPDPGRLPFMDIHQAGTKQIRYVYAYALQDSNAWHEADRQFRFDYVMLPRTLAGSPDLADFLDADSTWALVFADDAAALWLRRGGSCDSLARAEGYRFMPGGTLASGRVGLIATRDSVARPAIRAEFERAIASSPWNARAHMYAGNLDMLEGQYESARTHYAEALRQQPLEAMIRERLGLAQLLTGRAAEALASFRGERAVNPAWPEADLREGQALAALGRTAEARKAYERSLVRAPQLSEARDSLATLR